MLLHLTSGRGLSECELAVGRFLAVLAQEMPIEILAKKEGRFTGCLKSALVRTEKSDPFLQGTVQWVCKSPFRPLNKRRNWYIGVYQINEPSGCVYELGAGGGILFQTFKAGGKGGQHVNKTESAVRAIHVATGISAIASDERSQFQNKKAATERVSELLKCRGDIELEEEKSALFTNHNTLTRGNPIRIYEGMSFQRVDKDGIE